MGRLADRAAALDDRSRFAALSIVRPESAPILLEPVAGATFDALSGDGRTLVLSRRAGPDDTGEFALDAVQIRRSQPIVTSLTHPDATAPADAGVQAIPTQTPPVLTGTPVARAATPDATFTVYTGAQRPGVLEVRPGGTPAVRWHELPPAADDATVAGAWSIAARVDGQTVVAANGRLGQAYLVRESGPVLQIALAGHDDGPPALAVESGSTAYVLTDAGLEQLYLFEGTAHTSSPPAGLTRPPGDPRRGPAAGRRRGAAGRPGHHRLSGYSPGSRQRTMRRALPPVSSSRSFSDTPCQRSCGTIVRSTWP